MGEIEIGSNGKQIIYPILIIPKTRRIGFEGRRKIRAGGFNRVGNNECNGYSPK